MPFMVFSFSVKTEGGSDNPGRYLARYNPRATVMDFYDLSQEELRMLPFEIQIQSPSGRADPLLGNSQGYFGGGWTIEDGCPHRHHPLGPAPATRLARRLPALYGQRLHARFQRPPRHPPHPAAAGQPCHRQFARHLGHRAGRHHRIDRRPAPARRPFLPRQSGVVGRLVPLRHFPADLGRISPTRAPTKSWPRIS